MRVDLLVLFGTAALATTDTTPAAHLSITEKTVPTVEAADYHLDELRRRQQDVSYLTQVSLSSYVAQFPWPDPSTGPTWHTATCERNDYFAVRGGLGMCCNPPAGDCAFPTACSGNVVLGPNGASGTCQSGWTCQDVLIYDTKGSSTVNTYFVCKEGGYTSRSTWYGNRFTFPTTSTQITVVEVTSTAPVARVTSTSVTVVTPTHAVTGNSKDVGSRELPRIVAVLSLFILTMAFL